MDEVEYLIIGGGPTGLGAACRLQSLGREWVLLESARTFGGLAASFVDDQGFTWDYGGHVLFSHYESFDRKMEEVFDDRGWLTHERESWIWIKNRFVPYPFQNNLHRLDPADRWECVRGLLDVVNHPRKERPNNFAAWMTASMGSGISNLFLAPYNVKVWAFPAETMDFNWIGERVAVPSLETVLKSICTNEDEVSWGPNRVFRFPRCGGTGAIWQAIGESLPSARTVLGCRIDHIDPDARVARSSEGRCWKYRFLISTMPLTALVRIAGDVVPAERVGEFRHSGTHVIGVGITGEPPAHLRTKCWMYFPEPQSPYYRVTVFSNYSPNNVAKPGAQWSLMAEVSESAWKPVNEARLLRDTLDALTADGLVPDPESVCSLISRRIPFGYPTPFLGRDAVVDPVLRRFEACGIFSRGRFGAWKYEVGNMDHSFAQGRECVDRLVSGGGPEREPTLFDSAAVNSRRNP